MLIEIFCKVFVQFLLDSGLDLAGDQLFLGLRGELGIRDFDADDGSQTFPRIVAGRGHLHFLHQPLSLDVAVEGAGQCAAKAGKVSAAFVMQDIQR